MKKLLQLSLIISTIITISTSLVADISTKGGLSMKSDDGKYSFKLKGRIMHRCNGI